MPSRQAVPLTPLGSVHPAQLPFYKHSAPVTPLFAPLAKSAHLFHSTPLTFPLFSSTCSLFCSSEKLISFVSKRLQPLFQNHPGGGWGTSARHSRKNVCRECDLRIPDASAGRPSGPDPRFRPCWKGSRSPSDAPAVRAEASRGLTASMSSLDSAPQASGIPVHPLFRKVAVDSR